MIINDSPDISLLLIQFVIDLSTKKPKIIAENRSEGPNLSAVILAFEAYAPNGSTIWKGDLSTPDASGDFLATTLGPDQNTPASLPTFDGQIEWSGNPYRFKVTAQDSTGRIYEGAFQNGSICPPAGNKTAGGHYGQAQFDLNVDCNKGALYVKDVTNYVYNGQKDIHVSRVTRIKYPADDTGNFPDEKTFNEFSSFVEYLDYSGRDFNIAIAAVKRYELGDNVSVLIKYIKAQKFDANCNYDLCPLLYQYGKLIEEASVKCTAEMDRKIQKINALLLKAVIAKEQPTCGWDIGKIIDEIKELGDFDCDCECDRKMMVGSGSSAIAPGGLLINTTVEGDMYANVSYQGANILIELKDFTYIFKTGQNTSTAFSYKPATAGRTKTIELNVDTKILAQDMLVAIGSTPALLTTLKALTATSFEFVIDGKEIIQTKARCDFRFIGMNVPNDGTFVIFKDIIIDAIKYDINISFNVTTGLADLQDKLNSLNKGFFQVNGILPDQVQLITLENSRDIQSASIFYPGSASTVTLNKFVDNCKNSAPYTPSQVTQAIVDYLMALTVNQIKLGQDFTVCQIGDDGKLANVEFKKSNTLAQLIEVLKSNSCKFVSGVPSENGSISCSAVMSLFAANTKAIENSDVLYGTRSKTCGSWNMLELVENIAKTINSNTQNAGLKSLWCQAVNSCFTESVTCNPVPFVEVSYEQLKASDFIIVPGPCTGNPSDNSCRTLRYVGYYHNDTLDFDVVVRLGKKLIATGVIGVGTTDLTIQAGQNQILDIDATLPNPGAGYRWEVQSVVVPNPKKYLHVKYGNNNYSTYGVSYRIQGSSIGFNYQAYPAQPGSYSIQVFDVPENQYEASVVTYCAGDKVSAPVNAGVNTCPVPSIFTVNRVGSNFNINYAFPAGILKWNLFIKYPSNGQYNQTLDVELSGLKTIAIPGGDYGDYSFQARAVCNEATNYFGAFAGPIVINIPQPSSACPQVTGVEITNVTATTATITVKPPIDTTKVTGYTVTLSAPGEGPKTLSQVSAQPVFNFTQLTGNQNYTVNVNTSCEGGGQSTPFAGGAFNTQSATGAFRAFWGWVDVAGPISIASIESSGRYADFATGADIVANFTENSAPKFLWMAHPVTEPERHSWEVSANNYGGIGAGETFNVGTVSNGFTDYKLYMTTFKTQQTGGPIKFKV